METPRFGRKSNFLFIPGTKVSFECNQDFILIGDQRRVCTPEGRWNVPEYGYTECLREYFYPITRYINFPAAILSRLLNDPKRGGDKMETRYAEKVIDGNAHTHTQFTGPVELEADQFHQLGLKVKSNLSSQLQAANQHGSPLSRAEFIGLLIKLQFIYRNCCSLAEIISIDFNATLVALFLSSLLL